MPVLNLEKGATLAEDLGLVLGLDTKSQTRVKATYSRLEQGQE